MAEETNTLPMWKQKADKLNELLKENPDVGKQVVYQSRTGIQDDPVCVPLLVSEVMTQNEYPNVVEEPPATMINPKYNWYGEHKGWYENSTQEQGVEIATLKEDVKTVTESVNDLKENNKTVSDNAQKQDQKMDQLIKLVTMTNAQVGKIMQAQAPAKPTTEQPQEGGNK